jgi:hypothetical protein
MIAVRCQQKSNMYSASGNQQILDPIIKAVCCQQRSSSLEAEKQYYTQKNTGVRRQQRCSTLPAKKKNRLQSGADKFD